MEYLKSKIGFLTGLFSKRVEENERKKGTKYDYYIEKFYQVLSWEDNTYTLVVFLLCNFLFWFVVQSEIRALSMVFTGILIGFLWDTYMEFRDVPVYRGKYSDAFDEIKSSVNDLLSNLSNLRSECPFVFCLGMSSMFLSLGFVAKNMSGNLIVYLLMLAVFFVPLGFKVLPDEYKEYLKQLLGMVCSSRDVMSEEQMIAFLLNDFIQRDNDLDSILTDRTQDSQTNSLASGLSTMPSYMDVAELQEDIQEEDLIPDRKTKSGVSYTPGELSTDSDSDPQDMHFEPAHFKADSSSEDEKAFGSGLRFSTMPDSPDNHTAQQQGTGFGGVVSNLATVGSHLVANALRSAMQPAPKRKTSTSSSGSDFEIIDADNLSE